MKHKNTLNTAQYTLNCQGKIVDLSSPKVMGILNTTPDSFYAKSRATTVQQALQQAEQMLTDGAICLDIGGMSTRPGAELITWKEEWQRIEPILKAIRKEFNNCIISVDTIYASTATAAIEHGANIINDISGGKFDEKMRSMVAKLQCPFIVMHMKGNPQTMQQHTNYDNLLVEITDYFIERTIACKTAGIKDIVLDPGFGFSKTLAQNYQLLNGVHAFQFLEFPLLAGVSRKSMIWKQLESSAAEALNGTTALHMVCLQQGANLLRAHDVKQAVETITLFTALEKNN